MITSPFTWSDGGARELIRLPRDLGCREQLPRPADCQRLAAIGLRGEGWGEGKVVKT